MVAEGAPPVFDRPWLEQGHAAGADRYYGVQTVESRMGAVAWSRLANTPFPIPARRTQHANFQHYALRLASP
jgi:hypothetical protein